MKLPVYLGATFFSVDSVAFHLSSVTGVLHLLVDSYLFDG